MTNESYPEMFRRASGYEPHGYQVRVAAGDLPDLIEIPPGYGKTAAIVLAWVWRRRFSPDPKTRSSTPRRLIIALPMRSLADQVGREIVKWLENLGLVDDVDLHIIMGGSGQKARPWREQPERDSIMVGTIDMIVSKALVRAYGTPRNAFPMDAALVWNDAHLVVDEVQQAPATTVTLRQIDAFRRGRTAGPTGLTCMSATIPHELIDTIDNPWPQADRIIRLGEGDDTENLARRRAAVRTIRRLGTAPADPKALAAQALASHRPGGLTLLIVNTVKAARAVHRAIVRLGPTVEVRLLHSQFRPVDRIPTMDALAAGNPPDGRIVVATQVVEAGIDIDADVLITEVAPWSSMIQRAGRCNRAGRIDDAELWWVMPAKEPPYQGDDLAESERALAALEGERITSEALGRVEVATKPLNPLTLRRSDFFGLFDTSPDLSGHDLDIAPYVRDVDELSIQIAWLEWEGGAPPDDIRLPAPDYRCRVPLSGVRELIKAGKLVWRFDPVARGWRTIDARSPARPGDVLLLKASAGGYDRAVGFDPTAKKPVLLPDSDEPVDGLTNTVDDAADADSPSLGLAWVSLDQHLSETEAEAETLLARLDLPSEQADDVRLAARVHDIGKAHPTWQDALCRTAPESERQDVWAGRPWAKSAEGHGRLRYGGGITAFRHEFASLLLLDGTCSSLLTSAHDADLVRYLVLAHHGKLRVQIRDPKPPRDARLFGLADGEVDEIPAILDQPPVSLCVSLARAHLGGDPEAQVTSWTDVVARLIARYGLFRLAYLETLVRVADWRASALHDH